MNQTPQEPWTKQDLLEVAKRQKSIIGLMLISFLTMCIPFATIVTGIIQIYFIYKLAVALRMSAAWVYIILAFIPLVGLIALLVINGKATKRLKKNGIKVGLLGARMADFDKIPQPAQQGAPLDGDSAPLSLGVTGTPSMETILGLNAICQLLRGGSGEPSRKASLHASVNWYLTSPCGRITLDGAVAGAYTLRYNTRGGVCG